MDMERSIETELCLNLLVDAHKQGKERVSYKDFSEKVKIKINAGSSCLTSARRILLNQNHIVTETDRGVAITFPTDDVVARNKSHFSRARNLMLKSIKQFKTVTFENLLPEIQAEFNRNYSISSAIAHCAKPKTLARLAEIVPSPPARLPINETLEHMRKNGKS